MHTGKNRERKYPSRGEGALKPDAASHASKHHTGDSYPVGHAPDETACVPVTAAGGKQPVLYGISGMYTGKSITLSRGETIFGRNHSVCNLPFPGNTPCISRRHCTLSYDGQAVWLSDDNSSYGTFLGGGEKIKPGIKVQLKTGQRFYLANTKTMFELRQKQPTGGTEIGHMGIDGNKA